MRQTVYIIYDENNEYISKAMYDNDYFADRLYYSPDKELTSKILVNMASHCPGEYFYVVKTDKEITFPDFDFSFIPDEWDGKYIHIWNHDTTVRLFSKKHVLEYPENYTDEMLSSGLASLKIHPAKIFKEPAPYNIFFLSYDEPHAETHLQKLRVRYPNVYHIKGIKGIFEAHMLAARQAASNKSSMFYVVDADADVLPTFEFNHKISALDTVHVWHSHNPVNGLEYGYGGVKLFPTNLLLRYTGSPVDFTTSVSRHFRVIPEVSNITRFDTDPFSAWRSGFRECCKLASKIIHNQDNTETEYRLNVWCSVGNGEFGDFAVQGANEGAAYGRAHKDQPELLGLINDFIWLEHRFSS